MRRLATALLAMTAAGLAGPATAHAGPVGAYLAHDDATRLGEGFNDFSGGCVFDVLRYGPLTGDSWVGEVSVAIVATSAKVPDPGATVTGVYCTFSIWGVDQGVILTAPNGTGGTTANAGRFEYSVPLDIASFIELCTHATVNGVARTQCADGGVSEFPPSPLG
jgi:hypothetical protein